MRRRHGWRGLVLAGVVFAGAGGRASAPAGVEDVAGIWDLSLEPANAKCRIALRAGQSGEPRQPITVPLACLRAFPDLGPVAAWAVTGDGQLDLFDNAGETVLHFVVAEANAFTASGPQGEVYRLTAVQGVPQKNKPSIQQSGAAPATATITASKQPAGAAVAIKQDVPVAASVAGRYSILRDGGKDTGCMLTLDHHVKGPGGEKATLAPGCRDQGIVIFDPVGWQLVDGRLVLTARKGHTAHLDSQPDGTWKKDPKEGKGLSLKKL